MSTEQQPETFLDDWFGPSRNDATVIGDQLQRWFQGGETADRYWREHYGELYQSAVRGHLDHRAQDPSGRLALIVLLDQLSRSLHRGQPDAFGQDHRSAALTLAGVLTGMDRELSLTERTFFYMPLSHSEDLAAQEAGVALFTELAAAGECEAERQALGNFAEHARQHRDIIARFGRFPHRNRVLGRDSSAEETAWLEDGGPTFGQ